jgi:hypothetical protein
MAHNAHPTHNWVGFHPSFFCLECGAEAYAADGEAGPIYRVLDPMERGAAPCPVKERMEFRAYDPETQERYVFPASGLEAAQRAVRLWLARRHGDRPAAAYLVEVRSGMPVSRPVPVYNR